MDSAAFNRQATLRFDRQELLDDIKSYAYIEGETMQRDNERVKHHVYDIAEAGNIELVTRNMNKTFANCVEMCYPYTKKEVGQHTDTSNAYKEDGEYVLELLLPPTFSVTSVSVLKANIHDLIVSRVMEEWMALTKQESVPLWSGKALLAEQNIKSALCARTKPLRRKLSPF